MNQLNWEREKSVKPESGPLKNTIKLITIWAHLPIRETEKLKTQITNIRIGEGISL